VKTRENSSKKSEEPEEKLQPLGVVEVDTTTLKVLRGITVKVFDLTKVCILWNFGS
jgi:hypothetical protein